MFDIKVTGGRVIDGTGVEPVVTDMGITGDAITAVGSLGAAEAKLSVNAGGRLVTPGFIDAHSHSDTYLLIEPSAPSKIFQGITTEVVGNCGRSRTFSSPSGEIEEIRPAEDICTGDKDLYDRLPTGIVVAQKRQRQIGVADILNHLIVQASL